MRGRYQVGLSKGVSSAITELNPTLTPIVDTKVFGFGEVVAFTTTKEMAEKIVIFLNLEQLK